MIVFKYEDAVYISKSVSDMRNISAVRREKPLPDNLSTWHPNGRDNCLIATNMYEYRMADLLRYENVFPSQLDIKHILNEVYPIVFDLADRFGLVKEDELLSEVIFAKDGEAYVLTRSGFCRKIENLYMKTSDDRVVQAVYDQKGISDPYEFIQAVYRNLERFSGDKFFPVTVLNTKNKQIEVVTE